MADPKVLSLFNEFNKKYFWGKLDKVKVTWSPRMTLCAGKTAYKVRGRSFSSCTIRLSQPLLTQRPHSDTVNTLLHEMIHAYLHVTQGLNYRDSHGPEFRKHMKRINILHGSKITIYHNFHREVNKFRIHVYRCDGPCVSRRPFYGVLRRAIERPPGPTDRWWQRHAKECGGTFHKIEVVLAAEMKLHLQYCIDSDDEDDESFDDRNNKVSEGRDFEDKPRPGIVSCPSCMERVREEQIQEHLDQCLTFLAEEF
ncbi:putative sprT-like domain-containing protein Spartan [Penaeus vannamei]|uniref:Protein with SprT-like domain at the N terminus n=1 Tax=Penaeus vannamei TaxID=6689 RepID=A0A3R7LZ35_PENVA|nr:putative sprT-like domain-containing protein Spartan [Penaeus vannamei]